MTTDHIPAADRAALRDRIAEALYAHSHPGWATRYTNLDQDERDTYLARASAVLAVLPPPVSRADAYRVAADQYEEILASANTGQDPRYWTAVRDITLGLRHMADEAQPDTTPEPDPDCEHCDGSGLDPDAYFVEGDVWTHAPCSECLPEDDEPAPRREPHPTQADLDAALSIFARVQGRGAPAAGARQDGARS